MRPESSHRALPTGRTIRDVSALAPAAAIGAGIMALLAGILLAVFFATRVDAWGRANDAAGAVFAALLVPVALTLHGRLAEAGIASLVVAAIGLVSMAVAAATSVLTALGRLSIEQLTTWQGGSFAGLFAWVAGASILMLVTDELGAPLAWLGIAAAGLAVLATLDIVRIVRKVGMAGMATMQRPPTVAMISALAAFAAFPAWCIWLGLSL